MREVLAVGLDGAARRGDLRGDPISVGATALEGGLIAIDGLGGARGIGDRVEPLLGPASGFPFEAPFNESWIARVSC